MSNDDTLSACLDLARRLPPHRIEHNLERMCDILPDLADDLLSSVDQPLKVLVDSSSKQYLVCDYNRDGDSYRSPWTSTYTPPISDGTAPSPKLRTLEIAMNDAFDVYRDLYFEGGVSSAYLWDVDDGFAGVVLLQKATETSGSTSTWDSVHVFEACERGRTAHYKLTSTVMLYLVRKVVGGGDDDAGEVALGGSMTRQNEVEAPLDSSSATAQLGSHIANVGRIVEDMEIKMRNLLQEVYFSKTKDIVSSLRSTVGYGEQNKRMALQGELVGLLKGKHAAKAATGTLA